MVTQICKRCGAETATIHSRLYNYCDDGGWQWFSIRTESSKEKKLKMFDSKTVISWRGKTYKK